LQLSILFNFQTAKNKLQPMSLRAAAAGLGDGVNLQKGTGGGVREPARALVDHEGVDTALIAATSWMTSVCSDSKSLTMEDRTWFSKTA